VVIADIADTRGQALAEELGALYVHCDVGDKGQVEALVARCLTAHGRIDVLVNNAGIFKAADFLDISEADFDAVLRINLKGAFLVGQAVARVMAQAGRGAIVNMSSVNGVLAIPNIASYNVSKGGINQLTRVMALALADQGIRVNAVAPGTIATELAAKAVLTSDDAKAKILMRTPMKRLGEPSEIADTVAYLASDAASYITGETWCRRGAHDPNAPFRKRRARLRVGPQGGAARSALHHRGGGIGQRSHRTAARSPARRCVGTARWT
jgi:NAD(P)-dependent dehydrogenase (short-subunit alcohol dehydrogenase family)